MSANETDATLVLQYEHGFENYVVRPPGQSEEPGMGTQAAERERMRRGLGTVGKSVTRAPPAGTEYGCVRWRITYVGHCHD